MERRDSRDLKDNGGKPSVKLHRRSFDIDNLAGLRTWDHVLQVGILIDDASRIVSLFSFTLIATLLLILLFLFTGLLAAAFFQLAILITSL